MQDYLQNALASVQRLDRPEELSCFYPRSIPRGVSQLVVARMVEVADRLPVDGWTTSPDWQNALSLTGPGETLVALL